mmetsp:Transcript_29978/g.71410  ORF Transcript_29978/g.71410 Transcript_29978/m.71410 type:complete len:287 (-) Transcript_29978:231-1091(-)
MLLRACSPFVRCSSSATRASRVRRSPSALATRSARRFCSDADASLVSSSSRPRALLFCCSSSRARFCAAAASSASRCRSCRELMSASASDSFCLHSSRSRLDVSSSRCSSTVRSAWDSCLLGRPSELSAGASAGGAACAPEDPRDPPDLFELYCPRLPVSPSPSSQPSSSAPTVVSASTGDAIGELFSSCAETDASCRDFKFSVASSASSAAPVASAVYVSGPLGSVWHTCGRLVDELLATDTGSSYTPEYRGSLRSSSPVACGIDIALRHWKTILGPEEDSWIFH